MELTNTILDTIREAVGLTTEPSTFDNELLLHINTAVDKLSQNGVTIPTIVTAQTTWLDIQDITKDNRSFPSVPLYVMLSTKVIFDPPPPSAVEYQSGQISELLWRLKIAYEQEV